MSFAITLVALAGAGLALLGLLRLGAGDRATDLALGWLVGTGWLAAVAPVVRFGLGVPLGRAMLAAIVLAPVVAWGALELRRRRFDSAPAAEDAVASARTETPVRPERRDGEAGPESKGARWIPRPLWLFVPIALYVAIVTAAVLLHGTNTPTQTDDGVRVRAFAPMLAFADEWAPDARAIFTTAGPLPTFVPAVAWIATGSLDHFHVNYAILADLLALLVLSIGVASSRGSPERGWASAFGLLSIPLFVYHCTSTYSDAVLAMRVGAGVLFALEYARTRDRADAARALLLLGVAALVKREGELVAAAPAAVLLAQLAWERWREDRPLPWGAISLLGVPVALGAIGKISAVGIASAFPMLGFVVQQAGVAAGTVGARAPELSRQAAEIFFDRALFRSGNQGMIYWVLVATVALRARALVRTGGAWPLLGIAALFAEVAVSSIFLIPEFTIDQGTVNRALLVVSVPAAIWLGAVITDAVREDSLALAPETATPARAARASEGEKRRGGGKATPPPRRRARPGSRS